MNGRPDRLTVEHLRDPFGIGARQPRFSWWLPAGTKRQLAYRIRTDNGWDTGRIEGDESVLIPYGGPPLASAQRVSWQVKAWTDAGESDWSTPGAFELGLLTEDDWSARWISPLEDAVPSPGERPAWLLRGEFVIERPIARARLYASAHGLYEAFLNGHRVGDAELTPGFTAYHTRLQVQTFDVTELIREGANALGAILSDGWYRGQVGLARAHDEWGSELGLLAQLRVTHADGSQSSFATGEGWRSRRSHITAADLIAGETIDLRRYPVGWSAPVSTPQHGTARCPASAPLRRSYSRRPRPSGSSRRSDRLRSTPCREATSSISARTSTAGCASRISGPRAPS